MREVGLAGVKAAGSVFGGSDLMGMDVRPDEA